MSAAQATYPILRAACHVKARDNEDAGPMRPVVQNVGEPLQGLPPETRAHKSATTREPHEATNGNLCGIDKLITKARALAFIPVAGERDIRDRGSIEPEVCHYCRSLRRASSHSTNSATPLWMASSLASSSSR